MSENAPYKCGKLSTKAEVFRSFPRGIYSEIHDPEITRVMALALEPIRGFSPHSEETGKRLTMAIHRRRLSARSFLRRGERLYKG